MRRQDLRAHQGYPASKCAMSPCDRAILSLGHECPPITGQKEGRGTDKHAWTSEGPRSSTLHVASRPGHAPPGAKLTMVGSGLIARRDLNRQWMEDGNQPPASPVTNQARHTKRTARKGPSVPTPGCAKQPISAQRCISRSNEHPPACAKLTTTASGRLPDET